MTYSSCQGQARAGRRCEVNAQPRSAAAAKTSGHPVQGAKDRQGRSGVTGLTRRAYTEERRSVGCASRIVCHRKDQSPGACYTPRGHQRTVRPLKEVRQRRANIGRIRVCESPGGVKFMARMEGSAGCGRYEWGVIA